jgi:hypothetical protein
MTAKLACAASSAGMTPGRRSSSPSGAAGGSGDAPRVGPHRDHEREADEHEGTGREPERRERLAVEVAAGEQRAEHQRPEDRAEHGPEQHERDAVGAMLGRVHVAGRRAGQQRRAARRAHADQPGEDDRRDVRLAAQCGERGAERTGRETAGEHRHAADAVHQAPGRDGGQPRGGEEDRRAEPE